MLPLCTASVLRKGNTVLSLAYTKLNLFCDISSKLTWFLHWLGVLYEAPNLQRFFTAALVNHCWSCRRVSDVREKLVFQLERTHEVFSWKKKTYQNNLKQCWTSELWKGRGARSSGERNDFMAEISLPTLSPLYISMLPSPYCISDSPAIFLPHILWLLLPLRHI